MDRPSADGSRPSRTNTRGGIAPRFEMVTIVELFESEVVATITASLLVGGSWLVGPLNSALPAGASFWHSWVESPGDNTPPIITTPNPLRASVITLQLQPVHAGSWRLGVRYRATGLNGGMEIFPFVVRSVR